MFIVGLFGCAEYTEDTRTALEQTGLAIPAMAFPTESEEMGQTRHERVQNCADMDFTPIYNAIQQYGNGVAIYFENLETGCSFSHNGEQNFFAASIGKAPYAMWIYTLAEQGLIDLDATLTYREDHHVPGSGIIQHRYELGEEFTIRRLVALNLYESDNIATQMLRWEFGYADYANFIYHLGGRHYLINDLWNAQITANEAGFFMREIFDYMESGGRYSEEFRQFMLNNQHPFIVSDYPVASKTGWYRDFGGAWHDMAIVYAPSPYILVILSSDRTGTDEDHQAYQYISMAFQQLNHLNFVEITPDN